MVVVMRANIICRRTAVINVTITQQELCGAPATTEKLALVRANARMNVSLRNMWMMSVLVCLRVCV